MCNGVMAVRFPNRIKIKPKGLSKEIIPRRKWKEL
jgi:hypothetical protein